MAQKLTNSARSFLQGSITAASTSLVIEAPKADLFPVANTNTDAVNTVGKDWFKIVLQDTAGNREIAYVRTRASGVATMSNIIRGQEGTTALDFPAGSVVGLRLTALDLEAPLQLAAQATTPGKDLLWAATHDAQVQELGTPLQKQLVTAFTTAGTATAYTLTPNPVVTAYAENLSFDVTFHVACGASPTLEISGVPTPPNLVKQKLDGTYTNIEAGDIPINHRSRVTLLSPTQALVETAALVPLATSADKALRSYTATAGGTADAITATFSPNITALTDGLRVRVTGLSANTATNPTLAAGATAATVIKDYAGSNLAVAAIPPEADLVYSSAYSAWLLQNTGRTPAWVPAGIVAYFANSTAPAGWLKCNGATVSRTTYAALFAAIGTTYGVGDGLTTFALPDLRGEFLRGLDDGRGVDSGRAIGSAQGQSLQSHSHLYTWDSGGSGGEAMVTGARAPVNRESSYTGGAETRPRNVAMLACIKF